MYVMKVYCLSLYSLCCTKIVKRDVEFPISPLTSLLQLYLALSLSLCEHSPSSPAHSLVLHAATRLRTTQTAEREREKHYI